MKILHVLQNYEPSKGGTQFLFKSISEVLTNQYHDEIIVATTDSLYDPYSSTYERITPDYEVINGVHVFRFPYIRWHLKLIKLIEKVFFKLFGGRTSVFASLKKSPRSKPLTRFILDAEVDLVCASSSGYKYMDYALIRSKAKKPKPFVFMGAIHFDDERNLQLNNNTLSNIKWSDKYIANTKYEKECLVKLGVQPEKINVIGCGVNVEHFSKYDKSEIRKVYGIDKQSFVIGYVGRFTPTKGIETLIKAIDRLNLPDIILVLAGAHSPYIETLHSIIHANYNHISPRIKLILNFSEEDKPRIFSLMDVFVNTSFSESFGIVFLEAWASSLPVVGCDIGAIRSVVEDKVDGLLFEPGNDEQLSKHILRLFKSKELREKFARAGLKKVNKNYTWEKVANAYRNTYEEAIKIHKDK